MDVTVSRLLYVYLEPSTWLLVLLVVWIQVLSAKRSTSFSFKLEEEVALEAESSVLTVYSAAAIPIVGSLMLLALFYFLGQLFYFLVVLLGVAGFVSLVLFVFPTVQYFRVRFVPSIRPVQRCALRGRECVQPFLDLGLSAMVAMGVVVGWLLTQHRFFVDLLGVAMASEAIRTLRLPNVGVATLLLGVFFLYDIFWVFISPLIFSKSVMVEVAVGVTSAGIPLPLLIQVPKILFDGVGLLGLGDVILPGILLALLFRLDAEKAKDQLREKGRHNVSLLEVLAVERAYFWPAQTAYVVGFILTLAALAILQIGQPALLYLVPSVLGTTLVLAYSRGELRAILKGGSDAHTVAKGDQVDDIESGAMELDQMVQVNVDSDNFELESDLANPVTKYDEVHNTAGELEEL